MTMGTLALEEFELMKDDKYRVYVSAIDRALKSFENTSEWHDLISYLGKLNKVIKEYKRFHVVPRKIKIAKRLAQCMQVGLPAGVHLKALETYDIIFKGMGTSRLSQELFIYSAGLFPLLGHSAISVKQPLLKIYEEHFIPLGPCLLPGLSGFLNGVLLGLEEGSDHFEYTIRLLEKVCDGVGPINFYGCLWQCVAANGAVRLPSLSFVLSHFNKKISLDDQKHIIGPNSNIMVKALCVGAQDSNALVQRSTLDFLLIGFPMHNTMLDSEDIIRLVTASLSAILRRDVSLNRRLFAWLLGSELDINKLPPKHPFLQELEKIPNVPNSSVYFDLYSKDYLIEGIKATLKEMGSDIRPYRLVTSIMDKPDVGPIILDDILFDVFRVLYFTCKMQEQQGSPKKKQDIIKSANLFFNSLESWYIWQYLGSLFDQACRNNLAAQSSEPNGKNNDVKVKLVGSGIPNLWEVCEICEFLLEILPVEVSLESPGEHLMNLLIRFVALLTKYLDSFSCNQLCRSLGVCRTLFKKMHPPKINKAKFEYASDGETEKPSELLRPSVIRSMIGKEKSIPEDADISNDSGYESLKRIDKKIEDTEFGLMLKTFLKDFQMFFVAFVSGGRILNNLCVPKVFEKLKTTKSNNSDNYENDLRKLLNNVIMERTVANAELMRQISETDTEDLGFVVPGNEIWTECFEIACNILVNASQFPTCFTNVPSSSIVLAPWVKTLLVCCCYLEETPDIQLTGIHTFLKIVDQNNNKPEDEAQSSIALLDSYQVSYISKSTNILKILAQVLWTHLGQLKPQLQGRCIELLHDLLWTFTGDDSIEEIIGESLLKGNDVFRVQALLKFIKIWTIGRELQDGKHKRSFQSCLLKIFDNLLLGNNSPLRLQTEAWLSQALMRGDIARLLDPLLLILLDPATARLGILHVSIEPSATDPKPDDTSVDDTSKIYAISSVDGNVIYHVSDALRRDKNGVPKRLKWRWKKENISEQRVLTVTSLKGNTDMQIRYITQKNVSRSIELPRRNNGEVSLFVNPMSTRDDDDALSDVSETASDVLRNARRYNPLTGGIEDVLDTVPKITLEVSTQESTPERNVPKNKFLEFECDESESADEFFGGRKKCEDTSYKIARDILNTIIDDVVRKSETKAKISGVGVHPLHPHLLLYCGVYDSTRALYAFNSLRNILFTNPRLFLCCSATSGTVSASFPSDLLVLLARHRKSIFGRSFEGSVASVNEYLSTYRSSMYLEVLTSVCLYYARSYYPNLGHRLSPEVLAGNRLVQLTSIETLSVIMTELIPLVRESGKGFANYISTILSKCKVQKTILHCIMSSVIAIQQQQEVCNFRVGGRTFTEEIIEFNDVSDGISLTEHSRALQIQLLKLLLALIKLEHYVDNYKSETTDSTLPNSSNKDSSGTTLDSSYTPGYLIPQQPLFFRAVVGALALKNSMRRLHSHWSELITSSLPYLGAALPQIVMIVIDQLCINIEELAVVYSNNNSKEELPPDYAVSQLEALTMICHYCVLDSTQQASPFAFNADTGSTGSSLPNPGQILNNLVHVFTPLPLIQQNSIVPKVNKVPNKWVMSLLQKFPFLSDLLIGGVDESCKDKIQHMDTLMGVRRNVLCKMHRIISCLSALWTSISKSSHDEIILSGSPRIIRNQILEFLSPISLHHGPCFLTAIASAWNDRRARAPKPVIPIPTPDQEVLVQLISSIKVMPIDTLVQTVHLVLKQCSTQDPFLDVSVLELFYVYMQTATETQLGECWNSLLALLRDGCSFLPPVVFLVFAILNEYVQKAPTFQEKKDQRDLQDITAKLVEACSNVAGACLEQTTWLKRNLSVKDLNSMNDDDINAGQLGTQLHFSAQAQSLLAQILVSLLDVSYGSQEKEKVATILLNVMSNVTPYLKNHQSRYALNFQACSQLLANISGFPYTRKAWKKDAFDLLLDPSLFQMEPECLSYWITIVDNLMTHDQTSFSDLMNRIQTTPIPTYSLFSSRELEYEQRAQLIKRLAFVIMCSETDQFHKSMDTIQERLAESFRLSQLIPSIQAQVFLCFRVLLLRMSDHHVSTLWPIIITEMVQVFMNIEQELTNETEEFSSHIKVMSALDSSWVVNSSNGLNAHGHPHWLMLTLAAAKLLDLAVLMPANVLPQFQMYRWAFVGDTYSNIKHEGVKEDFVPHVERICRLMDEKYGACQLFVRAKEGQLLLTDNSIDSLRQLQPFFHALMTRPKSNNVDLAIIEKHLLKDFLEKLPSSPIH